MKKIKNKIKLFKKVNSFTGWLVQSKLNFLSEPVLSMLAKKTLKDNRAEKKESINDIAVEWQRMFGLDDYFKIIQVNENEALCEIHFDCVLAKKGDLNACHKLMGYDRAIVKAIGGHLTVLESRVDPSVTGPCVVSIRSNVS